jgi:uncharacterized protein (TIRG00374 family)
VIKGGALRLWIVLIVGMIGISIERVRRVINSIVMKIPSLFFFVSPPLRERIEKKFCTHLVRVLENLAAGFSLVKYPKKICMCLGLSLVIWLLLALSYYTMAQGCAGIALSFTELSAVMIIICFFIALPSAPGFWGLWEAGGVFGLSLFRVSSKDAAGFTLLIHAIHIFVIIIVGCISAAIIGTNVWQAAHKVKTQKGVSPA